jgi:hypothetical protein
MKLKDPLQEKFMPAVQSARSFLVLIMIAAFSLAARAAETTPAPAPAPAPAAAPAPPAAGEPPVISPAAIAAADTVLNDIGIKQSIALVVPGMLTELETNVTRTRPEIKESLRQTLRAIQPEFDKTAQETFDSAATLLASQMSEKEIVELAAFFESPVGKKYVAMEPVFLRQLSEVVAPWREKLSTDILVRARQEMKKKGVDF